MRVLCCCCLVLALSAADDSLVDLYERMAPAVVGITCKGEVNGQPGGYYGTGVVVSDAGLVLSNITVVPDDASDLKVIFTDGRIIPAELVASHAASEGVLIRLQGEHQGLVHMPVADSTACVVGDPVYSWGNPHLTIQRDGGVSLSVGRISAIGEIVSRDDQSAYAGVVIETDAAVNPGSDGGPLTDAAGHLIGIQSLAFADRSWLGLAVPTAALRAGLSELAALPTVSPAGKAGAAWARERTLAAAADKVAESVVGVWVERKGDAQKAPTNRSAPLTAKREVIGRRERAQQERQVPTGCGTGFVVSADGLVVTASINVIDRAKGKKKRKPQARQISKVWVYAADGGRHEAKLRGFDATRDLAVLQITGDKTWTPIVLDSANVPAVTVGNDVALLGRSMAPGDLSLNIGQISATHRNRGLHVQVSALMNYGNIGGPVIDEAGNVLGMANWLTPVTTWRQNCGVGFYLQADELAKAIPVLAKGKKLPPMHKPVLGIRLESGADEVGATIAEVLEGGAAAAAGLLDGDVIVGWEGDEVDSFITLLNRVESAGVGATVTLQVKRGGEIMNIELTIGSDADDDGKKTKSTPSKKKD